jgi:hypothetical protein
MKSFVYLKLPVLLVGLGAAMAFSPACKAQAEVNPDCFDNNEAAVAAPIAKSTSLRFTTALKNQKAKAGPQLKLAVVQPAQEALTPEAVAIQEKRRASSGKTDKK